MTVFPQNIFAQKKAEFQFFLDTLSTVSNKLYFNTSRIKISTSDACYASTVSLFSSRTIQHERWIIAMFGPKKGWISTFFGHSVVWYQLYSNTPKIKIVTSDACYSKKSFFILLQDRPIWKVKSSIFMPKKGSISIFFWHPERKKLFSNNPRIQMNTQYFWYKARFFSDLKEGFFIYNFWDTL